jgi:hypothetical protein
MSYCTVCNTHTRFEVTVISPHTVTAPSVGDIPLVLSPREHI